MKTDPNMLRTVLIAAIVALAVGAPPAFAEGGNFAPYRYKPAVEKKAVTQDEEKTAANPFAAKASNASDIKPMIGDK